jgi:hypothetical protein
MDRLRAHLELLNQSAALRRRSADLIDRARILCEMAAQTQAESRALREPGAQIGRVTLHEPRDRDLARKMRLP